MAPISGADLNGVVLGSADPQRLAAWYRAVLAPDVHDAYPVLRLSRALLIFEQRDDVGAAAAEPGRMILTVQVDELAVLLAHLAAMDVQWVRPVERIPVGSIATLADPDGNFVNILQLDA
jgi:predicted enzyme related to lactoylglutathione lyase